jgi:hypothetical protein
LQPCGTHRSPRDFSLQRWSSTERKLHRLADAQFSRCVAGRTPSNLHMHTEKGHFIAGPNGCKPVAHNALLTLSALSSSTRACPSHPNDGRGHLSHWSQTPRAKTPIQTARNSGSPSRPPRAAVRHASVVKHAREKQSDCKSDACSQHARSLPMGRELEIGPFPLEPNTKSQNTHWTVPIGAKHQEPKHPFGLPQGSPAQPTCAAVRHASSD